MVYVAAKGIELILKKRQLKFLSRESNGALVWVTKKNNGTSISGTYLNTAFETSLPLFFKACFSYDLPEPVECHKIVVLFTLHKENQ